MLQKMELDEKLKLLFESTEQKKIINYLHKCKKTYKIVFAGDNDRSWFEFDFVKKIV